MHITVPYTAIFRSPDGAYCFQHIDLPQGIPAARQWLDTDMHLNLEGNVEIVAVIPGVHTTDLPKREEKNYA
jgi:hypothetical protein